MDSILCNEALSETVSGELVPLGDPRAAFVFAGAGSTLEGDRAARYQARLEALRAFDKALADTEKATELARAEKADADARALADKAKAAEADKAKADKPA